jgi:type I restriction enzyme S subunit
MSFPAYESYQESGIDIFGKVPCHWAVQRLKNSSAINMGQSPSSDDYNTDGIGHGFLQGNADFGDEYPVARSFCPVATKLANPGDILFSVRAPVGAINTADQIYGIGRGLCAITASDSQCSRFLYYSLHLVREAMLSIATGSTYEAVTVNQVANAVCLAPPLPEQRAIASFLDRETSKIDALVSEQRRLVELLKEKRQAVISHAVTKGLDPTVPMKPSGIPWLGDVPAHWEVTRFGWVCDYISYGFTNPMPTADDGPYMLTANDIEYGGVKYESARRTSRDAYETLLTDKCRPVADDLLLTKDGTLGRIAIHDGRDACINQSVALLRVAKSRANPAFACLALQGSLYQGRMIYEAGGTTIKHIYISRLSQMPFAIPEISEQLIVVNNLKLRLSQFDSLIGEADRAVALLQERRTALISAAVTGKIDVRGFASKGAQA